MEMIGTQPNSSQIRIALRQIISDVIGADVSDVEDDLPLLDFVTSSLALVEGMRRVYDRFGVLISIRRIMEGEANLGGLAVYIEQALIAQQNAPADHSLAAESQPEESGERSIVPLAPSQRHVAFLARYSGGASAAYNEPMIVHLEGPLYGPALQAAVELAGERYEALRTAQSVDDDTLEVSQGERVQLRVSHLSPDEVDEKLSEIVNRPFETGEPMFRAELLRLSDSEHILALVGHALFLDYEAMSLVMNELASLYYTLSRGGETAAPAKAMQWTDYLAQKEDSSAEQKKAASRSFWSQTFSGGIPALELPSDYPRPAIKDYDGARLIVDVDSQLAQRFADWASSQGATLFDAWLSAFSLLLHRLSGQPEVIIGTSTVTPASTNTQPVVANGRNLLPLRSRLQPGRTLAEHVTGIKDSLAEASAHAHFSFAELIQALGVSRDQSRSAIFAAAFGMQLPSFVPEFDSLHSSLVAAPRVGARYDLELTLVGSEGGYQLWIDYSTQLLERETVARWAEGMLALISSAMEDDSQTCGSLPIMSPHERKTLLDVWTRSAKPLPSHKTVLDLIRESIDRSGDRIAIRSGTENWTYEELGAAIETIALALSANGVGPADRVGILLPRSPGLLAAMLAVWRAGATYVPLDLTFPEKRLAFMLADAQVKTAITNRELAPLIQDTVGGAPLTMELLRETDAAGAAKLNTARSTDSAYIIYTSGSTGRPKGVEVGHEGLSNLVLAARELLTFGAADSLYAISTISFDISAAEMFVPLVAGGTVDLAPDGLAADGIGLVRAIEERHPTFLQATPSTWKAVLSTGWGGDPELTLISAGESLDRSLAEQLIPRGNALWNLYGPTECTVYATAHKVTSAPEKPMPIGRAIPNSQTYIFDEMLQPLPIGVIGELYLGGAGVALGYWRQPQLTADRFIQHPFNAGERLYRTGDLARYLSNGEVEFLGRIDHQVKVHGVRIELGEVEAALREVEGIDDAVAVAWTDPHGDAQLVAHLLSNGNVKAPASAVIRSKMRERLPEVMIPPHFTFLDEFPLTANGKINRAALPAPDSVPAAKKRAGALPETATERLLAQAWSAVLDISVEQIGRDDDFMELGGHSLLMTPLMIQVRELFHVSFSLREFFGASTLRTLAALIDQQRRMRTAGANGSNGSLPVRNSDWGRERMAFLRRETQLPPTIAPARGQTFLPPSQIAVALLTGATGFIGTYIVSEILQTTEVKLYCLVRSRGGEDGKARIEKQMKRYAVWQEDAEWQAAWHARLHVVEGDVTLPRMGLADGTYEAMALEVDSIVHSAAHVNFIYPYEALRATNVLGLHEIIRFAFHARIKQLHHMSTAAIWPMGAEYTFYERDSIDHGHLLNLGYDEAKWVGEGCLINAADRGLPVARYRPGEVGGDSRTGRCVLDHFLFAAAKGFLQLGAFPSLDMFLDVTPADYVAKAFVHLAFQKNPLGRAFHLTNPNRCHMSEALTFLRGLGYRFTELQFEELRSRLLHSHNFSSNALFPYQATLEDMDDRSLQLPNYDCSETLRELEGSGIVCPPVDDTLLGTYVRYLRSVDFLPEPTEQSVVG